MLAHFNEMKRKVKVCKFTGGKLVDGEQIQGTKEEIDDEMVAIPITFKSMRNLPDGTYTTQDMKFYAQGEAQYRADDVIIYNDIEYTIRDISDRSLDADATIYYAKKEPNRA